MEERIYALLKSIPRGKVVTYGQLAACLGNRHLARYVGNVLHKNPDPIGAPCYKVVNSKGQLAKNFGDGGIAVQRQRLEADGIRVIKDTVDLTLYRYEFPQETG